MRKAFADEITKIASTRNDVVLLSGDIGNKMFDDFKEIAPNRFFNCGIAEASMTSIASGMALNNLKPIISSNSIWKNTAQDYIKKYYLSKNEFSKAKEFENLTK